MTHIDERDVRQALRAAANHVRPSPELLANARAGGRRRRRRARMTAVAATAAVAMAVGGLALATPSTRHRGGITAASVPRPVQDLLNRPTHGSLAGDQQYLRKVTDCWNAGTSLGKGPDERSQLGTPHVLWAGDTPAGPAAVVVQAGRTEDGLFESSLGMIAPDRTGRPTLLGENMFVPIENTDGSKESPSSFDLSVAGIFGARKPTLLVFSTYDMSFSRGRIYRADGTIDIPSVPIRLDEDIAVVALPTGTNTNRIIVARTPAKAQADKMTIFGQPVRVADQLPWPQTVWPLTQAVTPSSLSDEATLLSAALVPRLADELAVSIQNGAWYAQGVSPDGRQIVVGELQLDSDRGQIYAVLTSVRGDQVVVYGGPVDASKPLPVSIHLPDKQGWVVAQNTAALRYRSGGGQWHDAGHNAALVPDLPALQVEVTLSGGAPKVVPLH